MTFRSEWILVPLACLIMVWVLKTVQPACAWSDVMDALHVHNRSQYSMLACLGCVVVAIVAIARVLRRNDDE